MSLIKLSRRDLLKHSGIALTALALPFPFSSFTKFDSMITNKNFDAIIIGGSYAGLSAAMALGRAMRNVLVIDSSLPCNRFTKNSHNFITNDGVAPHTIAATAKEQVLKYPTVSFIAALAISATKIDETFIVQLDSGEKVKTAKLVFASGIIDKLPDIHGLLDAWGKSLIHCPYCHGYEAKNTPTAILANGEVAYHYAQLIGNWTKQLVILTNGKAQFSEEQHSLIAANKINIIEKEILEIVQHNGSIESVIFNDQSSIKVATIYHRPLFEQHCLIPKALACEFTEMGLIKVDMFQQTSIEGVFACGDNSSMLRSVANAVAAGNIAGAVVNNQLCITEFLKSSTNHD